MATAFPRPPPPSTALTVSSASALRLRYPTATPHPARASSSAVARPMPRPPPVTNARFPERSITTPPRNAEVRTRNAEQHWEVARGGDAHRSVPRSDFRVPRSDAQPLLNHLTHHVLDGEVQFLDPRRVIGRDDERHIGQCGELAAALAEQGDDGDAAGARRLRGADHVGALAARRVQRQHVARAGQGVELAGRDRSAPPGLGGGGQETRGRGGPPGPQPGPRRRGPAPVPALPLALRGPRVRPRTEPTERR